MTKPGTDDGQAAQFISGCCVGERSAVIVEKGYHHKFQYLQFGEELMVMKRQEH